MAIMRICVAIIALVCTDNSSALNPNTQDPSQTLVESPSSNVNTNVLNAAVDPRFSFTATYGGDSLSKTALFMNTIELMAQYAALGWTSSSSGRHGMVSQEYPQVEIAVVPAAPGTTMENRFVIWGIWLGMNDMIAKKKFDELEMDLAWNNNVVGHMYFTRPLDLAGKSAREVDNPIETDADLALSLKEVTNETLGLPTNSTPTAFSDLAVDAFDWVPAFPPGGKTLTPVEVFLTILAGLKTAARSGAANKVLAPFTTMADDVDAHVGFSFHGSRSPRTQRPFFQYIHVIKTLRLIFGFMLYKKKFSDIVFIIRISGLWLAEGYLNSGHYFQPISGPTIQAGLLPNISSFGDQR